MGIRDVGSKTNTFRLPFSMIFLGMYVYLSYHSETVKFINSGIFNPDLVLISKGLGHHWRCFSISKDEIFKISIILKALPKLQH
jgi:hypothetical protein